MCGSIGTDRIFLMHHIVVEYDVGREAYIFCFDVRCSGI